MWENEDYQISLYDLNLGSNTAPIATAKGTDLNIRTFLP